LGILLAHGADRRSSAGGSRSAGGIAFQADVFAWWATLSIASRAIGLGLEQKPTVTAVGSETSLGVDDVGATLSNGGFVLIQAKHGMRRLARNAPDVRSAVDQIVRVYRSGMPTADQRRLNPDTDRLIIATDHSSSEAFNSLSRVCDQLRAHPLGLPAEHATGSEAERTALLTFIEVIRTSWLSAVGTTPSDAEVRSLLKVLAIKYYDFSEFGADRIRADAMLNGADVPDAFRLLSTEGVQCAATRSWRSRSDLRQVVGLPSTPDAEGGRFETLARELQRLSEARRAVRLQAFELDEVSLATYFNGIEVVQVPNNGVLVLVGDFGSGKSEAAETWHRYAIKNFRTANDAPFPVWLSARDLSGLTLERGVEDLVGSAWRDGRGASIAVDAVDETDPATAQALLNAARTISRAFPNVRVLMTTRPGILAPSSVEERAAPLLSKRDAFALIELAGGRSQTPRAWTEFMQATVTRPFFALAAGIMLSRNDIPRGEVDLIRGLVENVLVHGSERSVMTSAETRSSLQKLAVSLTRTGEDRLSLADRLIAQSSRLVAASRNGRTRFSLPIFQHWFAAQAILDGEVQAAEVVEDARSFNRWRWAAAVAAQSASHSEVVDALLGAWVSANPGAASWILKEAFGGLQDSRDQGDGDLDPRTSGPRLLQSVRTWGDALGPLAEGVLPYPLIRGPVEIGVGVSGQTIQVAFSKSRPASDTVGEIPAGFDPWFPGAMSDWQGWFSSIAPRSEAWPWVMVQRRIAATTSTKLSTDPQIGAVDGIWTHERRFDLARRLLDRGSLFHTDLPADAVRTRATVLFEDLGRDPSATFSFDRRTRFVGSELDDLISWIDRTASRHILWQLPQQDLSQPTSQWIWGYYSLNRLMEFEAEVYGRACAAYDEALTHSFARLDWSMPGSAYAPFGVVLEFRIPGDDQLKSVPILNVIRVPMDLMTDFTAHSPRAMWSTCGRAMITQHDDSPTREGPLATLDRIHAWVVEHKREPIASLSYVTTGADDLGNVRPASSLAAGWLWRDLHSIGLGSGHSPDLY